MTYFGGTLALNVGRACRNQRAAARRARANSSHCEGGLNGKMAATVSSFANISEATRRYFSALRRPSVAMRASTWTRSKTSSAVGGGRVSGSSSSTHGFPAVQHERPITLHGEASPYVGFHTHSGESRHSAADPDNSVCAPPTRLAPVRAKAGAGDQSFGPRHPFLKAQSAAPQAEACRFVRLADHPLQSTISRNPSVFPSVSLVPHVAATRPCEVSQ